MFRSMPVAGWLDQRELNVHMYTKHLQGRVLVFASLLNIGNVLEHVRKGYILIPHFASHLC